MKAIKIIFVIGALLICIVAGLLFFVFSNINQIVKDVIETVGPDVTETTVTLDDVDIELLEGKGQLNSFLIGNPRGFDSEYLLKWDTVRVEIDPNSLRSDVIVIKDVLIEGVDIKAEQKGYGTNLQKLMDTLTSDTPSDKGASPDTGGSGSDVRLALEKLRFSDNTVDFITEKYGSYTLELPSFEVAGIGDPNKGLTPEELGQAVLQPLLKQAKQSVENRLKSLVKEELEAKLDEKKEELKAKVKEKEGELKNKLEQEEARLDEKKDKLKAKLGGEAEEKLKNLFKRD